MNEQTPTTTTAAPTWRARFAAWRDTKVPADVFFSYGAQVSCYGVALGNVAMAGALAPARVALLFAANGVSLFCAAAFLPLYRCARTKASRARALVDMADKMVGMADRVMERVTTPTSGALACPKCHNPVLKGTHEKPTLECAACHLEFIAAITPDGLMALMANGEAMSMHLRSDDDTPAAGPRTKH